MESRSAVQLRLLLKYRQAIRKVTAVHARSAIAASHPPAPRDSTTAAITSSTPATKARNPPLSASDSSGISHRLLNRDHLERAHGFFDQYGGKAVVLSRFMPIVRTFLPFVAGAAAMPPAAFALYNLIGAVGWVGLCLGAGWLFGNVPIIKENFSLVTIGIVIVSLLPMVFEYLRARRHKSA